MGSIHAVGAGIVAGVVTTIRRRQARQANTTCEKRYEYDSEDEKRWNRIVSLQNRQTALVVGMVLFMALVIFFST